MNAAGAGVVQHLLHIAPAAEVGLVGGTGRLEAGHALAAEQAAQLANHLRLAERIGLQGRGGIDGVELLAIQLLLHRLGELPLLRSRDTRLASLPRRERRVVLPELRGKRVGLREVLLLCRERLLRRAGPWRSAAGGLD